MCLLSRHQLGGGLVYNHNLEPATLCCWYLCFHRLSEAACPGLSWLEVIVDTEDSSPVVSVPTPVMFTYQQDVAVELNRLLQAGNQCFSQALVDILEVSWRGVLEPFPPPNPGVHLSESPRVDLIMHVAFVVSWGLSSAVHQGEASSCVSNWNLSH